jgi:hypothetical protein
MTGSTLRDGELPARYRAVGARSILLQVQSIEPTSTGQFFETFRQISDRPSNAPSYLNRASTRLHAAVSLPVRVRRRCAVNTLASSVAATAGAHNGGRRQPIECEQSLLLNTLLQPQLRSEPEPTPASRDFNMASAARLPRRRAALSDAIRCGARDFWRSRPVLPGVAAGTHRDSDAGRCSSLGRRRRGQR